jgi:predicted enzyme related to lactoylglutathione lyase
MQSVIHFEMVAKDPQKAIDFYTNVFGWDFKPVAPGKYWTITTTQSGQQGINGGLTPFGTPETPFEMSRVANSILVPDVDQFTDKVKKAGGKIVKDKVHQQGFGDLAICEDTNGITFGVYKPD